MIPQAHIFLLHPQLQQPIPAEGTPVGKPLQIGARLAEKFQLHLLKFPDTEDEVAGSDFIPEAFAHLGHAEGQLFAGGALHVLEVDENALGGFRPQIHLVFRILGDALMGAEHQVELADIGKIVAAAVGAADVMLLDEFHHPLIAPAVRDGTVEILDQLVGAMTAFAVPAIHQRVGESAHMAGSHPHLPVHQDGAVQPDIGGAFLNEFLPPCALDVVFQLHAQRAVIPGVGETAVDIRAGIDEAAALTERDDFLHGFVRVVHV